MSSRIVFLDTQFTNVLEPQLLSLGMVTLDGRHEFYAELDLDSEIGRVRVGATSWFARHVGVFEQWGAVPGATCSVKEVAERSGQWLIERAEEAGGPLEVAHDDCIDFDLLSDALRECGLWNQVSNIVLPVNVVALTGTVKGEFAAIARWKVLGDRGLHKHHALADVLALRAAFEAIEPT